MMRRWGSVHVAPLTPADLDWAHRLDTETIARGAPATGGADPLAGGPEQRWLGLWDGAFQLAAHCDRRETPFGLFTLYGWSRTSGTVQLAGASDPSVHGSGLMARGFGLVVDWVFTTWNARIVTLEANELSAARLRTMIGPMMHAEGRLRDYYRAPEGYLDKVLLAVHRDVWMDSWHPVIESLDAGTTPADRRRTLHLLREARRPVAEGAA